MYTFMKAGFWRFSLVKYSKEGQNDKSWICYSLYYKTYVRDQDYSNMIIVLR